jgi:hypothetical protein
MMAAVTIAAPPVQASGDLVEFDEARFAEAWDGTMLRTLAALQDAFASLSASGGGRITVELPSGSSAVALAVIEGVLRLARSAALAWATHGIEVECIPPST